MKKILVTLACGLLVAVLGCSSEGSAASEDEGTSEEALLGTAGYCQIGTNGLLTGSCLSISANNCGIKASASCPSGATPITVGSAYSALCYPSAQSRDTGRSCRNY